MNGIPAILLAVSTAVTAVGSQLDGKKKNIITLTGIGIAIVACAIAAEKEKKKALNKPKEEI